MLHCSIWQFLCFMLFIIVIIVNSCIHFSTWLQWWALFFSLCFHIHSKFSFRSGGQGMFCAHFKPWGHSVVATHCSTLLWLKNTGALQTQQIVHWQQLFGIKLCFSALFHPPLDHCVLPGPGHQPVQPVWGRDPPGAGGQEKAGRGAETETGRFQRAAIGLQVTTSLTSGPSLSVLY